jgi:DNA polymerase-3 subunit beta
MKFTCQRNILTEAFSKVAGLCPSRTPKVILQSVKVVVSNNVATFISSDSETGMRVSIPVESTGSGESLLLAEKVMSILRVVSDGVIVINILKNKIEIKCGYSEFSLSTADSQDFPPVEDFAATDYLVMSGAAMRQMIIKTVFAADEASTRYAMGGVFVDHKQTETRFSATDGRRLSCVRVDSKVVGNVPDAIRGVATVIPKKAIVHIEKILSDDEEVLLKITPTTVSVKCGESVLNCQLVQGLFPEVERVIPTTSNATINLVAGPFANLVRQSMVVTNETSAGVDFTFEKGQLKAESAVADMGTALNQIPIPYDGETIVICLIPKYLLDYLKALNASDTIELRLIDAESAILFLTPDYRHVIMPLNRD